jgi:hypothetical protein
LNRVARRNYHDRSQYPEVFFEIETSLNSVCAWIKNYKYFCNYKISIAMLGLHIEEIGHLIKRLTSFVTRAVSFTNCSSAIPLRIDRLPSKLDSFLS